MSEKWDKYWDSIENRRYWMEPDKAVVHLLTRIKRSKIMNMLDLGCGTGRHALFFAKAGLDVTAVDSSVEALSVLQKQSHEEGVTIKIIKGEYSQD